jgi:hypothetical protein
MALRRSQEAKADLRAAYERLLEVGKATLKQAGLVRDLLGESPSARKVADEISRFSELLEWAVGQARWRVVERERLEAEEKLHFLFEEHTVVIHRGKARKQTEFGREVWLSEVDGVIVSGFKAILGESSAPVRQASRTGGGGPQRTLQRQRAAGKGVQCKEGMPAQGGKEEHLARGNRGARMVQEGEEVSGRHRRAHKRHEAPPISGKVPR